MSVASRALVPEVLMRRIQQDFAAIPGLCLTRPQVRRLWGLTEAQVALMVDTLIAKRVLHVDDTGRLRAIQG